MEPSIKNKKLHIGGMTCISCQNKIEKKLRNISGVKKIEVSYSTGTASIAYDKTLISLEDITAVVEKLGYDVISENGGQAPTAGRIAGLLIIIVSAYMFLEHFGILNLLAPSLLAETDMSYGMLFVIGLLTSVHCIAMCGGINLSQCISADENAESHPLYPAFWYNIGRVLSYTAVGFIVGAAGSVVTFSNITQGVLKLTAGVFMVIMGMSMLNLFPWLRKLTPRMPKLIAGEIHKKKSKNNSPLIVGLLNGLMPCGPLQAMQIYALSTGNPVTGALSMMLFSLGTVPLMLGLGATGSALSRKSAGKIMTAGAVLVVTLGLSMLSQGWNLSGLRVSKSVNASQPELAGNLDTVMENGMQIVNSTLLPREYPTITVQAGTPVKWIIDAPKGSINGCNNRMVIGEYNLEHSFSYGENIIEFTPEEPGVFRYSCWMGMIRGTINVAESLAEQDYFQKTAFPTDSVQPEVDGGDCCSGGHYY